MPIKNTLSAFALCALTLGAAAPAAACEVALLLTIDVSGSIDSGEYKIQTEGMATALTSPEIADALELGQVALAVIQWSGSGQQQLSIPWRRMLSRAEIERFAERAREMPRAFKASDTAVGEAVNFALAQFRDVADCRRKVIDISGDGPANSGVQPSGPRQMAERMGVDINGITIESIGMSITAFYRRSVITKNGFVMTANGHSEYARTIHAKILRELTKPSS